METIQVVLDATLLRAADGAAKRAKMNRSALIRDALREHLKRIETREREAQDRRGYERHPAASDDAADWERVAAWPEP
jgi:metal-responsive CopG/Arc/MetJ family transcriptional regulator